MDGGGRTAQGTVTSLSSLFSPDEVQSAARRVEEAIAERTGELDRVLSFVEDNSSLVKLVQRLPDQLHHDIMVPFGKGALLPGRLVHTNEFMVLLGEGYYADRTAKQTVGILNRRGKELESQAESLKAMIKDLRAEASFFNDTANEAAEGHVEIIEDYVEEVQTGKESSKDPMENKNINNSVEDEEFAKIMARMEELEALEEEEMAAEGENSYDDRLISGNTMEKAEEDELSTEHSSDTDTDDDEEDDDDEIKGIEFGNIENRKSKFNQILPRDPVSHSVRVSERYQSETTATNFFQHGDQKYLDNPELKGSAARHVPRGGILLRKDLAPGSSSNSISNKVSWAPEVKENPIGQSSRERTPVQPPQPAFDSQKAFTGSIVERPYNLEPQNQAGLTAQSSGLLPSKPVSRFKLQRK